MTDLELTKACAEVTGLPVIESLHPDPVWVYPFEGFHRIYDPLHDDAQAMALVKKLRLRIDPPHEPPFGHWYVESADEKYQSFGDDLNRAICDCAAKVKMGGGS